MSFHDWLDEADQLGVLREIARQLARIGDTLDELRPDPCGESNMMYLGKTVVHEDELRYCERASGHPKDFHMGGGERWSA